MILGGFFNPLRLNQSLSFENAYVFKNKKIKYMYLSSDLTNLNNSHALQVVDRASETQVQASENY